ncbi:serine/threonine-protein kinase ppk15 isoform X2 [Carica papaya]|uniref:serine/threonine-protein kinase ppk15 isoform X2 n=1 Tax=Carica papaya TaxID=3649 RepID=UPI000B8CD43A|nr:serine/threonine-protein kinase ppk15 isoform X2 [Carica papaya]
MVVIVENLDRVAMGRVQMMSLLAWFPLLVVLVLRFVGEISFSYAEFTNPYGHHSTAQADSDGSSSDRLSQFGTARDYPEINGSYWYDEKDEDYFMTPVFTGPDFFGCPSEDKFIMTSDSEKQFENIPVLYDKYEGYQTEAGSDYLDKPCLFNMLPMDNDNAEDCYHFDKPNKVEGIMEGKLSCYSCSAPLCKCHAGSGGFYAGDFVDYGSSKETKYSHFYMKDVDDIGSKYIGVSKGASDMSFKVSEDKVDPNRTDAYDDGDGEVLEELNEPKAAANEDGNNDDDLLYDTNEDEYEVFNLRIIHRKNRTGFEENKDLPIVLNTVIGGRYYVTEYLGSAAFSKVVQAHDLHMGIDVCLKIIKNDKDFFDQSLDEIKLLKLVNKHDPGDERHILRLYDYFYHQEHLFIVCELLRANLYEFQKFNQESGGEPYFNPSRLQVIARQCLEALEYLHHMGIIHCDLKPENVLIKSYRRCEIKIIDLGSSCFRNDNLCLYVQSRSYRAPEVILGLPYDEKIDLWSLGCILAELCSGEVLFPNDAVVMILARMIGMLRPIDMEMLVMGQETHKYFTKEYDLYHINEETDQLEYIIPEKSSLEHHLQVSDAGFIDFVKNLLEINPQRRPTAREALEDPWLTSSY